MTYIIPIILIVIWAIGNTLCIAGNCIHLVFIAAIFILIVNCVNKHCLTDIKFLN